MTKTLKSLCFSMVAFFLISIAFASVLAQKAHAEGTFISAPSRVDMVYDDARRILYITSGGQVLRYSLDSNSFLAPFELGGDLKGIDISRDGNSLAVADQTACGIDIVDLSTGQSNKIAFVPANYEKGTFSVAFGYDSSLLVTSSFEGSGWVPLRKYNPKTGEASTLGSVRQDSMLCASADRSVIGFAESNNSDGPFGRYRVSDGNLLRENGYDDGTSAFNYEIGVNRDGSQYALPTGDGTYITDSGLKKQAILGVYAGGQPIGVAYSPVKDVVYFPWATTSKVYAYDTTTFQRIGSYEFENTFDRPGNHAFQEGRLRVSGDGRFLFATVQGGVRCVDLSTSSGGSATLPTEEPATFTWLSAKTTLVTNPLVPDGLDGWYKGKPAVALTSNTTATIYYQWDSTSGSWSTYAGPFNLPSQGSHVLYYYSVSDKGARESNKSAVIKWDCQAPTCPSKLTVAGRFANLFFLTWQLSDDNVKVTGYEEEWSADKSNWKEVAEPESLDLNTLYATYYFRARAFDQAENYSQWSEVASAKGYLEAEALIISKDGNFALIYQSDGNLVLYRGRDNAALWSTRTNGSKPGKTVMQSDGNLVVYDANGKAKWSSRTNGHPGSRLVLQNDANLVIYSREGKALWSTKTQGKY